MPVPVFRPVMPPSSAVRTARGCGAWGAVKNVKMDVPSVPMGPDVFVLVSGATSANAAPGVPLWSSVVTKSSLLVDGPPTHVTIHAPFGDRAMRGVNAHAPSSIGVGGIG